jgi:hypothetical protein
MTDSNSSTVSLSRRLHAALRRTDRTVGAAWVAVVAVCILSRLATTITYIEDPDSLRFALSVADAYDLAALQPHFPGYPVFWAAAEVFYLPTGSFSTSFSLVGGLATAGLIAALLQIRRVPLASPEGLALTAAVFVNPLVWLMGNRYMPDLLGTTCALATLAFLADALTGEKTGERSAAIGVLLSGLLAGLRLSYMPLVVVPALWVLVRSRRPLRLVAVGTAGVAVWLAPMIVDTGFRTLVDVAWEQTTGHFTEFGGTVQTESDLSRRVAGFVRGLWADGLGAWWPGRHPLTLAVGAGMLAPGEDGTRTLPAVLDRTRLCRTLRRLGVLLPERDSQKPPSPAPPPSSSPAAGRRGGVAVARLPPGARTRNRRPRRLRRRHLCARQPAPRPIRHRAGENLCRDGNPIVARSRPRRLHSARQHLPAEAARGRPLPLG